MASWGQILFQDSASPLINSLINFHDLTLVILIIIITFVSYAILALIMNSFICRNILDAQEIETIWAILPAIVLIFLALPSLRLLYLLDELDQPSITIKTIGHQWYWSYEYSDFLNLEFDSYIIQEDDLLIGQFRSLEVDNRLVLPWGIKTRILVTAADVIHSWTIPRLGVKVDALPGRLNQLSILASIPGVFYGQCSEICGANHSFIPIALEVVNHNSFISWVNNFSE